MKQDDIVVLDIIDYGVNGEGIAKVDGLVIFIPDAIVGEKIQAKISFVKKTFALATIISIITSSIHRQKPICNRSDRCGGCALLHIDYNEQLAIKLNAFINTYRKNCNQTPIVSAIIPSNKQYEYRNKIQLPFGIVNGKVALGFYRANTHKIVAITKCFLHGDWVETLIDILLNYANNNCLTVYDEIKGKGLLRHLVARYINNKLAVVLVINGKVLPNVKHLTNALTANFQDFSLHISPNTASNNIIMGDTIIPIVDNVNELDVLGIKFKLNPLSFVQINDSIRDIIYQDVIKMIAPTSNTIVIDAYSGVGVLGAILAKDGAQVYNIEIVPEAIEDAEKLYLANGQQATNICGDAARELPNVINKIKFNNDSNSKIKNKFFKEITAKAAIALEKIPPILKEESAKNAILDVPQSLDINKEKIDNESIIDTVATKLGTQNNDLVIILDPPRKGCDISVLNAIKQIDIPHKVIYISCNPSTLTRDLSILNSEDVSTNLAIDSESPLKEDSTFSRYITSPIKLYDMFPNTPHVETLVCLQRK